MPAPVDQKSLSQAELNKLAKLLDELIRVELDDSLEFHAARAE
ncbi:hypothetical protein [Saccharopolyspora shandongensis]